MLGTYAVRINSVFTWDDLVVEDGVRRQMEHICNQIKYRSIVADDWDFYKKSPYGRGICALFYGSPGTGKTMAVQVIANELGLDLYRIDLSQMVSKYIGETEKNISSLFERAKDINALLFFDEADAFFAKRSDVSDSNDRNANAETAHLLQKLEEYEGITILATNLKENIDEAFRRRIRFMIHFRLPDADVRRTLWHKMFPPQAPLEEDVDLDFFAEQFELSGSAIKEIVFNAAYMAAAEHGSIGNRHIIEALKLNFQALWDRGGYSEPESVSRQPPQNQNESEEKENLKRYQEAEISEQTRTDEMEYSHWEILERLKKMQGFPIEAIVSSYISMGGGKEYIESDFLQVTPRSLLEYEKNHIHGEAWDKHNERITGIMHVRSQGLEAVTSEYEKMVDSSGKTIFGANFYKADTLKEYVLPRLTPGFIKEREGGFLVARAADIDNRLTIISRGMADNVSSEDQEAAFREYIESGTRFGKRKWDWLGANTMVRDKAKELAGDENYSGPAALETFVTGKINEYKEKMDNLNRPVRVLNKAIDELTEMISTSQGAIDELEAIQRDPRGFFSTQDLTDNVLTDVGEQYDTLEQAVNTQKPLPEDLQNDIDNLVLTDEIPEIDLDQLLGL